MSEIGMVVDDDAAVCFTVKTVLGKAGLDFVCATSGPEALTRLRGGFRGLILMDVMMPRMDGWDTIDAMVGEGLENGNVICMLTAVGSPGPKMEKLQGHVADYIRKPFDAFELVETVRRYMTLIPEK